jgi:hypothetical protein
MLIENALPTTLTASPLPQRPGQAKADGVPTHSKTPFFDTALVGAAQEVFA